MRAIVLILLISLCGCLSKPSLTGNWKGEYKSSLGTDGQDLSYRVTLRQKGEKLEGEYTFQSKSRFKTIEESGKVQGNFQNNEAKLSFVPSKKATITEKWSDVILFKFSQDEDHDHLRSGLAWIYKERL